MLRRFGSASLGLALACSQTAMAATRVVPGASLGADACGWQEQVPAEYHGVNANLNAVSAPRRRPPTFGRSAVTLSSRPTRQPWSRPTAAKRLGLARLAQFCGGKETRTPDPH